MRKGISLEQEGNATSNSSAESTDIGNLASRVGTGDGRKASGGGVGAVSVVGGESRGSESGNENLVLHCKKY